MRRIYLAAAERASSYAPQKAGIDLELCGEDEEGPSDYSQAREQDHARVLAVASFEQRASRRPANKRAVC
jgi:hypothetical protein